MNNRWKMNRMGFVNFWLYDEEVFSFADGKLLLRGQNGSGKSITTQSFIPFILDGDRTPSRLDPFGSSDRKMEYYFLGESGKDESTGYLFLEFKKEHSNQYRTIGIGQRAQRGKPMGFWGFLILGNHRIGQDLYLYKEVGSTKIPFGKQELKKAFGEKAVYADDPGTYKALVNKHIFGFPRLEQYDQFIRLLVKVRAPKLSKELKPTKVYEILNESLQTLTDEDLRPMADAMERMDGIQSNLEHLRKATDDARIIRTEYLRYNQFMLSRKAKAYLDSKQKSESVQEMLTEKKQSLETSRQKKLQDEHSAEAASRTLSCVKDEISAMGQNNLTVVTARLEDNRRELVKEKDLLDACNRYIADCQHRIDEFDREHHWIQKDVDGVLSELRKAQQNLSDYQSLLHLPAHASVETVLNTSISSRGQLQPPNLDEIAKTLKEWRQKIDAGLVVLREHQRISKEVDEAVRALEQCRQELDQADAALADAQKADEDARDNLIEAFHSCAARFQEMRLDDEMLASIESAIIAYQGHEMAGKIQKVTADSHDQLRTKLLDDILYQKNQMASISAKRKEALQEKDNILNQRELEPTRRQSTTLSREQLVRRGIPFTPFYRAVEFSPNLSENQCAMLEAQLQDAGLLDALVVAKEDREKFQRLFPELTDTLICVDTAGNSDFDDLIVNDELPVPLKEETACILRHIYKNDTKHSGLALDGSGAFRNGILLGQSRPETESRYVGQLARRRNRERLLLECEQRISQLDQELQLHQEQKAELERRSRCLEEEYHALPTAADLDCALQALRECEAKRERAHETWNAAQQKTDRLNAEKQRSLQRVLSACKLLPYSRTVEDYVEIQSNMEDYIDQWNEARSNMQSLGFLSGKAQAALDGIEREGEAIDQHDLTRKDYKSKLQRIEAAIKNDEDFLQRPEVRMQAQRLQELLTQQESLQDKISALGKSIAVCESEIQRLVGVIAACQTDLTEAILKEEELTKYFREELSLGLVLKQEDRSLEACAREAVNLLRAVDRERDVSGITSSLHNLYQKNNGSLSKYRTQFEDCFADAQEPQALRRREQIVAYMNGRKMYFEEFYTMLCSQVEETEELIRQKDRELFEDILSKTLSQQLTTRISESRQWIADMSDLMKQMDTSMAMTFSLEWRPNVSENTQQIDTAELEKLLMMDKDILPQEDIARLSTHFRSLINTQKEELEREDKSVNYMDLVRNALDYRTWFKFQMNFYRQQEGKKPLTNAAFNKFSGGEKAMAMYVPLFAAVNAQYQKAGKADHPRMLALDEAFAGVDDKNISSMFALLNQLDFDYILNSQALWGCYETVPGLRISELLRPNNADVVTVIHYTWNGKERVLDGL